MRIWFVCFAIEIYYEARPYECQEIVFGVVQCECATCYCLHVRHQTDSGGVLMVRIYVVPCIFCHSSS